MTNDPQSVFRYEDGWYIPTGLSRGPWDENAQHGGAPAALLAHLAEQAAGAGFLLSRLTFELTRPIPIAPIHITADTGKGRNVRRVDFVIAHDGAPVGRAVALMVREQPVAVPAWPSARLEPGPEACHERFATPGMPSGERFHDQTLDIRLAIGTTREPGPAAAWFRLRYPILADSPITPVMRAGAAADFGNGLSWVLPFEDYVFANTDLTFYLFRAPVGEWIGVEARTEIHDHGIGLASATLYDTTGVIGKAHQNLLIRAR